MAGRFYIRYILVALLILFAVLYVVFWDYLPPRTPYKAAKSISGIKLPVGMDVILFEEEWSFSGDGYALIVFKLNAKQLQKIGQELKNKKDLSTIDDSFKKKMLYDIIYNKRLIEQSDSGYFQLMPDKKGYSVIVVNLTKHYLIIYDSCCQNHLNSYRQPLSSTTDEKTPATTGLL